MQKLLIEEPSVCSVPTSVSPADLEYQLLEAAKAGDLDNVRRILSASPSQSQLVNCRDLDGRHSTPLHFAAGYNRLAVVEYLLQHGADVQVNVSFGSRSEKMEFLSECHQNNPEFSWNVLHFCNIF